jgi:hypothetical protein
MKDIDVIRKAKEEIKECYNQIKEHSDRSAMIKLLIESPSEETFCKIIQEYSITINESPKLYSALNHLNSILNGNISGLENIDTIISRAAALKEIREFAKEIAEYKVNNTNEDKQDPEKIIKIEPLKRKSPDIFFLKQDQIKCLDNSKKLPSITLEKEDIKKADESYNDLKKIKSEPSTSIKAKSSTPSNCSNLGC